MSWYSDWFNSEYYLKVYSHRNESEAERLVQLIVENVSLPINSSIIDMACGSGRHSIVFARKGYDVTAVDLSERLVTEAKMIAEKSKVNIDFVLSDILEFKSDKKFDLALNLFTSFGYFESDDENFRLLLKAYELLNTDGYFVIDYFNINYLLKNLVPTSILSENWLRIIQNRSIQGNRVRKDISIENNKSVERYYESVRLYNYSDMINFINKAGFCKIKEYGDYNGSNFNDDSSPRLIIFAKK